MSECDETGGLHVDFPEQLPISARLADLRSALEEHQVVVVVGATGSGKTTQLPKIALSMGRGEGRLIGVTQPRRIAATSVASRVASELACSLGDEVGYQIRFDAKLGDRTRIKFMTDGILLAEIQGDRLLQRYDTLIIDEAHERSITIDFLLGWLKAILPKRPDLKVLVSSATIETERFSRFFDGAKVVEVEGRTFPVDVLYEPPEEEMETPRAVAQAVETLTSLDPEGDVLVFLPGEREIRETERKLLALSLPLTTVQPLYSRLSAADQRKVFADVPGRRIILATNVAETSLTLPGIVYVVDTGEARLSRYDPQSGITRLQIEEISQASADQRKGRCGRVREGICLRLYDEENFQARPQFTDPEIQRIGLSGVILRMKALGLGQVEDFPFLDEPRPKAIREGYRVLEELGALDSARELTPLGRRLARFPVDPRIGRMILAGQDLGCLEEVLVVAAALNLQDPRERPRGEEQRADQVHRQFVDERSDFVTLLAIWRFVSEAQERGTSRLRRACKDTYLSFRRVREWRELHRQLTDTLREETRGRGRRKPRRGPEKDAGGGKARPQAPRDGHSALHRALLSGLLSRIGQYVPEKRVYNGARQTRFSIHPSSGLAKKPPAWIMAFELVQTSRLFARTVAKIEPEWLDEVGGHLLKRKLSEPHWNERAGRATAREQATLFGLQVFKNRSVDYSNVSQVRARLMFLEHALVRGEYQSRGAFQEKNRELMEEVGRLRDKARLGTLEADEEALIAFFDRRVPQDVVNGKTFEAWYRRADTEAQRSLELSLEEVLGDASPVAPEDYPDSIELHGVQVPLRYEFDPRSESDGVSLEIPLALLPQLHPKELDWIIPGWHSEKIAALLERLPRALRRGLGPLRELVEFLSAQLTPFEGDFTEQLSRLTFERTGQEVPEDAWPLEQLPGHLRLNYRLVGEGGKPLAEGRDLSQLIREHSVQAQQAVSQVTSESSWERSGLVTWDFGELPPYVQRKVLGAEVRVYPALVDRGFSVDMTLLESRAAAEEATFAGVLRLLALACQRELKPLAKRAPPPFPSASGMPASGAQRAAFTDLVLMRTLQEAFFGTANGAVASSAEASGAGERLEGRLPRQRKELERLLNSGRPRIAAAFDAVEKAVREVGAELSLTQRAMAAASREPSGKLALADIQQQVRALFPEDLLRSAELSRLAQYPRYLRAARSRLERAIHNPRKDAEKREPFDPLWASFLEKQNKRQAKKQGDAAAREAEALDALRWDFEELRIALFAPEERPAYSISCRLVAEALADLH